LFAALSSEKFRQLFSELVAHAEMLRPSPSHIWDNKSLQSPFCFAKILEILRSAFSARVPTNCHRLNLTAMTETQTGNIKIIEPFRWWKTFGINSAIGALFGYPIAINYLSSYKVAKGVHDHGLTYAVGAFNGSFVFASALIGGFLALMLCTAQMWALVAYYRSDGNTNIYYSRLYAVSTVVLIISLVGVFISPIWTLVSLIYYFARRRLVLDRIRELEGGPPRPPVAKIDYTWPLVAFAAAILIAAAIIYAASQHHPAPSMTTPPSAPATPVPPQAHRGDFDPNNAIPAEDAHKMQELGGWRFFESKEYLFSVCLPETPTAKQRVDSKSGISVTDFTCLGHDKTKGYLFSITTTNDTSGGGSREALFNGISHPKINGIAGAPLTYLGEARDLNGHKGKEYIANTVTGGVEMVVKYRAFLENRKAYGVGVTAPKDLWNDEAPNAYLNTFRIYNQ
jgi:hypothetical protein